MSRFIQSRGAPAPRSAPGLTEIDPIEAQQAARRHSPLVGAGVSLARDQAEKNKEQAAKFLAELDLAGITRGREREAAESMLEGGAIKKEGWLLRNLDNIDKPMRLVKLGIIDAFQLDKNHGAGEIQFWDTAKKIMAGDTETVKQRLGSLAGERGDLSTDAIFRSLGWDNKDINIAHKVLRGVAHLGVDILTDPISLASFGLAGVGKKAAAAGVSKTIGRWGDDAAESFLKREAIEGIEETGVRKIREQMELLAKDIDLEDIMRQELLNGPVNDMVVRRAAVDALRKQAQDAVEAPILAAYMRRDLGAVPVWFRSSKAVIKHEPYLQGGIRLGMPLGRGFKGLPPVPHTVGLGRKATRAVFGRVATEEKGGRGLAQFLDETGAFKWANRQLARTDMNRTIFALWKEGDPRNLPIARVLLNGTNEALTELGLRDLNHEIGVVGRHWEAATRPLDEETRRRARREFSTLQNSRMAQEDMDAFRMRMMELPNMTEEMAADAVEYASRLRHVYDSMFEKGRKMGMDLGHQKNYLPLHWTEHMSTFMRRLADEGAEIPVDEMPEELRRGAAYLSEATAAMQRQKPATRSGAVVGDAAHAQQRHLGIGVEFDQARVRQIGGMTLFELDEVAEIGFESIVDMNDEIMAAAAWLADHRGMKLGGLFAADAALELDPSRQIVAYMGDMTAALQERWLVRKLMEVGGLQKASFSHDLGRVMARVVDNLQSDSAQRVLAKKRDEIVNAVEHGIYELDVPYARSQSVYIGPLLGSIEIPANVIDHPRVVRAIAKAKEREAAWQSSKTTMQRRVQQGYDRLVNLGMDPAEAAAFAASTSADDMRAILRAARAAATDDARAMTDELTDIMARMADDAAEMSEMKARAQRQAVKVTRAAERTIAKSADSLDRAVLREVTRVGGRRSTVATFESEEARRALSVRLIDSITSRLDNIADEAVEATELRAALEMFADGGSLDELAGVLSDFLRRGREGLVSKPSKHQFNEARGVAAELVQRLHRAKVLTKEQARAIYALPDSGADVTIFKALEDIRTRLWAARRGLTGQNQELAGQRIKELETLIDAFEEADGIFSMVANRTPQDWQYRQFLDGNELAETVELLRKISAGQNVYRHPNLQRRLRVLLDDAGMLTQGQQLTVRKGGLGFQIVEDVPYASMRQLKRELSALGIETAQEALGDPRVLGRLSEEAANTLANLNKLPDGVALVEGFESMIAEGAVGLAALKRSAEEGVSPVAVAARNAAKAERILNELDTVVVRVVNRASSTESQLDAAAQAFRRLSREAEEFLAPAERVILDGYGEVLGRRQALARAALGADRTLRNAIDSAADYRRAAMYDPETTAASLGELVEDISKKRLSKEMSKEQYKAVEMLNELQEVWGRMIGLSTQDGVVRRGFMSPDEEAVIGKAIERGNHLWKKLGFDEASPFEMQVTPTMGVDGFVPPSAAHMQGEVWEGMLGNKYAMQWMEDWTAKIVSLNTPEGFAYFAHAVRKITSWWKAQATVARPTFHIRNVLGGIWNGMMADVGAVHYNISIFQTPKFLRAVAREANIEDALKVLPPRVRRAYRAAWEAGVFADTFSAQEVLHNITKMNRSSRYNPMSTQGPIVRTGGEAMKHLEGQMRMAVFLRHFDSTVADTAQAGAWAKSWVDMVHFNYSELTQFEQNLKQFIPFFVWFRRNLPLQLQTLVERPQILQRYNHLIKAVEGQNHRESDNLPPDRYRQEGLYARLGMLNEDSEFYAHIIFDPDLPISTLFEDFDNPLSPQSWLSLLINQLGPGFDLLKTFQGVGEDDYWQTAPGGMSQIINAMPGWAQDRIGGRSGGGGVGRVSSTAATVLGTIYPGLAEHGGLMLEQAPHRRMNRGMLPVGEEGGAGPLGAYGWQLLRGLGIQVQGVDQSYSNAVGSHFELQDIRREMLKGDISPEIVQVVEEQFKKSDKRIDPARERRLQEIMAAAGIAPKS